MGRFLIDDRAHGMRVGLFIAALSLGWAAVSIARQPTGPRCQPAGPIVRIPDLPEGSGVAVSRRSPHRLWAGA